jgi:hypothetical protein
VDTFGTSPICSLKSGIRLITDKGLQLGWGSFSVYRKILGVFKKPVFRFYQSSSTKKSKITEKVEEPGKNEIKKATVCAVSALL